MEEFIPISAGAAVPKTVKNDNKINLEKKGKRKKIRKGKKIVKGKRGEKTRQTKKLEVQDQEPSPYRIKLIFQQRCPPCSEIVKLHPLIRRVFIPKRPPSIRHCFLKFKSAEDLEEVRSFLDKRHFEQFWGVLRCHKPLSQHINEIKTSNPELLDQEYLTPLDIKHAKFVVNKRLRATLDVKCNSTARELFLRYGIPLVIKKEEPNAEDAPSSSMGEDQNGMKEKQNAEDAPSFSMGEDQNGMDAPSFPIGEEQNGSNSPSTSMSEEDDDMNEPEAY